MLLDTATSFGISHAEVLELVEADSRRESRLGKIKIAFIECNREQVDYFAPLQLNWILALPLPVGVGRDQAKS